MRAPPQVQRQCTHHQQYRGGRHNGQNGIQFEGMAQASEHKGHGQHTQGSGQGVTPQMDGRHASGIADQGKREQGNEPGQENRNEQEPLRTARREYRVIFKLLLNGITPKHPRQIERNQRTDQGSNHRDHCSVEHAVHQAGSGADR